MSRIPIIIVGLLLAGCALDNDPCRTAAAIPMGSRGAAGLTVSVIAMESPRSSSNLVLDCVEVTALSAHDYSDTLLTATAALEGDRVTFGGLPVDTIDVVFDRRGFFPIKITDVALDDRGHLFGERLTLYPSSAPVVLPGQLYLNLKTGATLEQLEPILSLFEDLAVHPEPGGYRLELAVTNRKKMAVLTEDLCRRLLFSPLVEAAGPLARFSSVY